MTPTNYELEHARLTARIDAVQRKLARARRLVSYLDELGSGGAEGSPADGAAPTQPRGRRAKRGPTIQAGLEQLLAGGARLKLREVGDGLAALAVAFKPNSLRSALSQLKKKGVVVTHPSPGRGDLYALP